MAAVNRGDEEEEEEEGKDLAKAGEGQLGLGHSGSVIVWDSCQ